MLKIVPLKGEHLENASELVTRRYKKLCEQQPLLPHRYKEISSLLPLLQNIMKAGSPGVVALQDGKLVGFLTGWLMPGFRGKRSVYSPEWANAADLKNSRYIYEEMYSHLAATWVSKKFVSHYISMFANDQEAIQGWHWLGFGMLGVDAIRSLQPLKNTDVQIDIRLASSGDLDQFMELNDGLREFAKGSPYFFISDGHTKGYFEGWIDDPDRWIWLAYVDGEPVAFFRVGPANDDACEIIHDEKTTSIYGAFTEESKRGKAIGTALLGRVLESARSKGYERCAVDFESTNLLGTRFWLRHDFKPVCLSLQRNVDERVL